MQTNAGLNVLCRREHSAKERIRRDRLQLMIDSTRTQQNTPEERDSSSEATLPRLTKEQINSFPIMKYEGPIHLVRDADHAEMAAEELAKETILGFDTEARPTFRSGQKHLPAVLQLAGETAVYVFQLRQCGLTAPLRQLLSDPDITKAGVALDRDIKELTELAPFEPAGFVDVAELAKQAGCANQGLRGLASLLLGFRVSKSCQTSNWAQPKLTRAQIEYAATDGWVGRELYQKLQEMLS